jgi:hypothetical protein
VTRYGFRLGFLDTGSITRSSAFFFPWIHEVKEIPPFSKEIYKGDTVSTDEHGLREGFLENVKMTKCGERKAIPHMAGFYPSADALEYTKAEGNPAHPEFKNKSDDGLPSFPAPFSKKDLKGEPKRTPGH